MIARLFLLLPLLLVSCQSTPADGSSGSGPKATSLLHGIDCGVAEPGVHVARTPEEWRKLWDALTRNRVPKPPAPSVDWEHDMVVCVTLGARSSGGYAVAVEGLRFEGDQIVVEARETKPAADAVVPLIATAPYAMITTPKHAGTAVLALK